jgi:hypothetical protein
MACLIAQKRVGEKEPTFQNRHDFLITDTQHQHTTNNKNTFEINELLRIALFRFFSDTMASIALSD